MNLCAYCGQATIGFGSICPHHASSHGDDWATSNRIMCDLVHRGVVSSSPTDRKRHMEFHLGRLEEALAE